MVLFLFFSPLFMTLKNKFIYTSGFLLLLLFVYLVARTNEQAYARQQLELYNKQIQLLQADIEKITTDAQAKVDKIQAEIDTMQVKTSSYESILSIPKAGAFWNKEKLEFGQNIDISEMAFSYPMTYIRIWEWVNAPAWKNDFLKRIQIKFYEEGYMPDEVKLIVQQTIQESGVNLRSENKTAYEHSFGLWQLNKHKLEKPDNFLHQNDDTAFYSQLGWFVDRINYFKSQNRPSFECVIVAHNMPSSIKSWKHDLCVNTKYFKDVAKRESEISAIQ